MDRDTVLTAIDRAFGGLPRPETMVRNPKHCDECADHEATMQGVTPQTVSLEQVGSPAWDPVCFLSDESFCYFMPGLARLALEVEGYYVGQLLFHLDQGFRVDAFNPEQRRAVAQLMDLVGETMLDALSEFDALALGRVMDSLAGEPPE